MKALQHTINIWAIGRACLLAFFFTLLNSLAANASSIDNAFQWWTPVYLDTKVVNPKLRLYLEANPRLNDNLNGINQLLLRSAIGYQPRQNLAIYQGYAHVGNFLPEYVQENRSYQQIGYGHVVKNRLQILHRFRSEQRFIQTRDGVSNRLRYMLRLAYRLKNTRYYLVGYDEIFVNVNSLKNGPNQGIDQNRLFLGVGRQINKRLRTEIGYQNQYVNNSDPVNDRAAHTLLTQVFINF